MPRLVPAFAMLALALTPAPSHGAGRDLCREAGDTTVWVSPATPVVGQTVRLTVVSEAPRPGELRAIFPGQSPEPLPTSHRGGPPYSASADFRPAKAGSWQIELADQGRAVACTRLTVGARHTRPPKSPAAAVWRTSRAWDRAAESFYSAWIEALFDAPAGESLSVPSLEPLLRDPARNRLWGHLELGEDDASSGRALPASPDCADLPYYLRAYFSWKLGLPFAFRDCDRGTATRPPRCGALIDNEQPPDRRARDPLDAFRRFLRQLANKVHSGSARTALADEQTDYYPIPLARENLRPGTVFADPYGHILMIVKWQPQTAQAGGRLFAVDGQPDDSVGRKRFWEGTFLFASDVPSAGPGFKSFRPVERGPDGRPAPLSGQALGAEPRFAPFSLEQARLSSEDFYTRMARLINPRGLDPVAAYEETLAALVEQLETRIGSVDNGERYMRENAQPVVEMPDGAKIFETVGAWEDYATPSRDMRLLIAMNVLLALPDRVAKHPELFVLGGRKPQEVRTELLRLHQRRVRERAIEYRRSDGSPQRLSVADLLARKSAFEMAYNPNDCVEVRWGASPETADFATCRRRAPEEQRARMALYRSWFAETRRPTR